VNHIVANGNPRPVTWTFGSGPKILLSPLHPDSGTVTLLGERVPGSSPQRIGYLPEHARGVAETLRRFLSGDAACPELLLLDGPMDRIDAASLVAQGWRDDSFDFARSLVPGIAVQRSRYPEPGEDRGVNGTRMRGACRGAAGWPPNELAVLGHAVGFGGHSRLVASQDRLQ
jgi:hypothetical protein